MVHLLIICPLRPGTQEQWRRLYQDIAGSRRAPFEAFCRQAGISQVQVWLVQLRRGDLLLMRLRAQQPHLPCWNWRTRRDRLNAGCVGSYRACWDGMCRRCYLNSSRSRSSPGQTRSLVQKQPG